MSGVRADKRHESMLQCIIDLKKLCIDVIDMMNKYHPKGQDNILKSILSNEIMEAYSEATMANDMFIGNIDPIKDYNFRREHFEKAKGLLKAVASELDIYVASTEKDPKINTGKLLKKLERYYVSLYSIISGITGVMKYDTTKCKDILSKQKHIVVDTNPICESCDNKTLLLKDLKKELNRAVKDSDKYHFNKVDKQYYTTALEYQYGLKYNDKNGRVIRKAVVFANPEYIRNEFPDSDPGYFHNILASTYSSRTLEEVDGEVKIVCPSHLNFTCNEPLSA